MVSFLSHLTIDSHDAYALSEWWKPVLGYVDVPDDPNEPGHEECMIVRPDHGHRILFIEVPDVKQGKNRLHLDLRPVEGTRDAEIDRVVGLGATVVEDLRNEDGTGWVVLADPEGNEFCILRAASELTAPEDASEVAVFDRLIGRSWSLEGIRRAGSPA